MKALILLLGALALSTVARAQIPVTDAASIANNRAAQAENLAKWAESIQNLRTQIDALNQQINIQSDIRRWTGNPVEAGTNLVLTGLGGPDLARDFGSAKRAVVGLVDSLGSLQRTAEGTYRAIESTDINGNEMKRDPMVYRRFSILDAKQDVSTAVASETRDRERELQTEIASTLEELKGAETDAEVQKLSAKLAALNGQITHVEAERRREVDSVVLQKIANDSRADTEHRAAAELEAKNDYLAHQRISAYMNTLKVRQKHEPPD
jgi:hypothetical protein